MENIIRKREGERQDAKVVGALEEKIRGLEADREKLITDNVQLIR